MNATHPSSHLTPPAAAASTGGDEVTAFMLMSRPVATIDHTATVRQATETLAADGIGALLVLHDTALVGVVSERDVVAHLALGVNLDHLEVGEVMQGDVVTVTGDTPAVEAAATMVSADVRHLPVLVDGTVAGMLSVKDVLAALCATRAASAP